MLRAHTASAIAGLLALVVAGCGDNAVAPTRGPVRVQITPIADTTGVGDTLTPVAQVLDADGALITDSVVHFESSAPAVLQVLGDGRVRAVGTGSAVLRARVGPARDSLVINVTRRPRMLRIALPGDSLSPGAYYVSRVLVLDGLGDSLAVASNVAWTTSDSTVLRLVPPPSADIPMRVETVAFGAADLVVTSGALTGRVRIRVVPLQVFGGLAGIEQVTRSDSQICVRTGAGQVFCTGDGVTTVRTGFGGRAQTSPPTPAQLPVPVIDLFHNGAFLCGRATARDVYCWGSNLRILSAADGLVPLPTRLPIPDSVEAVASLAVGYRGESVCLIAVGGTLDCMGSNTWGNIGPGGATGPAFRRLLGAPPLVRARLGEDISCGVTADGAVWCWGGAASYTLGTHSDAPERVPLDFRALDVAVTGESACAIDDAGAVYCWGDNNVGSTGQPVSSARQAPMRVPVPGRFTTIQGGYYNACTLSDAGELWCWGDMTGLGSVAPFRFAPNEKFKHLWVNGFIGRGAVCGVTLDGRVLCSARPAQFLGTLP